MIEHFPTKLQTLFNNLGPRSIISDMRYTNLFYEFE